MCRLFGFRSVLESGVHQSLLSADNAIIQQSEKHPDGWGVAYYKMKCPHVIKMDDQAKTSGIFQKVSGIVSSNTVLAHIRKSTVGDKGPLNTHPFQFGQWTFAHNGNIIDYDKHRKTLLGLVDKEFQPFILGDTDSELLFYVLLTKIQTYESLQSFSGKPEVVKKILTEFVKDIEAICGALSISKGEYDKNYLTFVVTDGQFLMGFQGGQKLRYSTHKGRCSQRDTCEFFQEICEKQAEPNQRVHHLVLSSEEIINENEWIELDFQSFVGVTDDFQFFKGQL